MFEVQFNSLAMLIKYSLSINTVIKLLNIK